MLLLLSFDIKGQFFLMARFVQQAFSGTHHENYVKIMQLLKFIIYVQYRGGIFVIRAIILKHIYIQNFLLSYVGITKSDKEIFSINNVLTRRVIYIWCFQTHKFLFLTRHITKVLFSLNCFEQQVHI